MQDCSLHFGGLTCWHASAKLQCFVLLYRDAGGSGASQTRGAPQSYCSKSNSMLQSTRSPSVWHVRRVLGSASMLAVVTVCGRSKPRQRRRRAFAAEVICLSESGMISVRRRGRD